MLDHAFVNVTLFALNFNVNKVYPPATCILSKRSLVLKPMEILEINFRKGDFTNQPSL